jgi:hypothetical protein
MTLLEEHDMWMTNLLKELNIIPCEGIIMTHSIDKSLSSLKSIFTENEYHMKFFKKEDKILVKFDHNRQQEINLDLTEMDFGYLLKIMRNLGYHPSYFSTIISVGSWTPYDEHEILRILNLKDKNGIDFIMFNPTHSNKIIDSEDLPNILYHGTPSIYKDKILKMGLVPKTKDKIEVHPDRIYFSVDLDGVYDLLKNKKFITNKNTNKPYDSFSIFEFDLKEYKDHALKVEFCVDNTFKSKGIFTLNNISPKYLKLIKDLKFENGTYKE